MSKSKKPIEVETQDSSDTDKDCINCRGFITKVKPNHCRVYAIDPEKNLAPECPAYFSK